jgi:hypothetical protein
MDAAGFSDVFIISEAVGCHILAAKTADLVQTTECWVNICPEERVSNRMLRVIT